MFPPETTSTDWPLYAASALLEARGHDAQSALLEVVGRLQGRAGHDHDWRELSPYRVAQVIRILVTGANDGGCF
jgi:hypothetical protein